MSPIRILVRIAGLGVLLVVAGCNVISSSDLYFNSGLADGRNSVILTNIIRSAKGYPTYFSAVGDYNQSNNVNLDQEAFYDPGISGGFPELNFNLSPSFSRNRNANVSSLESNDFVRSMHSSIPPSLFLSLAESRDRAHLHLTLMLLTKAVQVTVKEYVNVVSSAWKTCSTEFQSLPSLQRGICLNYANTPDDPNCPRVLDFSRTTPPSGVVRLNNDASTPCQFMQFRTFVEALVVLQPSVQTGGDDGDTSVVVGGNSATVPVRQTFGGPNIGYELRSPNEVIYYLGEIVRDSRSGSSAETFSISTREGRNAPIMVVESGGDGGVSAVKAQVDGATYWLRQQELGGPTRDYSHRSLALVKDLIVLNTSQSQLATNQTIILDQR